MPWRETSPMEQRLEFVREYESGMFTMTELAAEYGISRKTGYKWPRARWGCKIGRGGRITTLTRSPRRWSMRSSRFDAGIHAGGRRSC